MTKLTEHFSTSELDCPCCGRSQINPHLLVMLELVRVKFDKPVNVNSAYRCPKHNQAVGGRKASQHLLGNAADIWIEGVSPLDIYEFLAETFPSGYGFACYLDNGFVHVDVRLSNTWRDADMH